MILSTVNFLELYRYIRIDAEFYKPEYIKISSLLKNKVTIFPLRKYCNFIKKGIFDINPELYSDNGIPLIRTSEIKNPLINFSTTVFLSPIIHKENLKTEIKPDDIVITKIGAYIGDVALLPNKYRQYNFSQNVTGLSVKNKSINSKYLFSFLLSRFGRSQLTRIIMLSGQGKIELDDIRDISIYEATNMFQSQVAKVIEISQSFISQSEEKFIKAQSILLSELGLTNWQPKHQLSFIRKFSEVEEDWRMDAEYYQPKYDELIEIISASSAYSKTIAEIQTYNARGLQPEYDENGKLDVIASRHILENGLDYDSFERTDSVNWNNQKKARVYKGDILTYTTGANIGRTACYSSDKQALASNHVNILRIKDEQPEYVAFVMNSMVGRLQTDRLSAGSAQAELYPKDIEKYVIPFIAEQAQQNIISSLEESRILKEQSKHLLECAKRAVEIAIEQDEQAAIEWLERETA